MTPLRLPAELTIYTVTELHPQWLAWAAAHVDGDATVEADAVQDVDGAGLQLLLALHRQLSQHGHRLQLQAPSTPLQRACTALGLQAWWAEVAPTCSTEAA